MYYPGHPYYDQAGLPRKTGSLIAKELPRDGNRSWKVTTQPAIEPVTLAETKVFARITTTAEDDLIEGFISAARYAAEEYLGRAFISQTIATVLDFWPGQIVRLPKPPLISVDGIYIVDEDDAETEYDSDYYYLNTVSDPGQIIIKRDYTPPTNTARDYGRFLIRSKHGYGTERTDVPIPFREGIMLWAAVIYATRTLDPKKPPPEVRSKFDIYKTVGNIIR